MKGILTFVSWVIVIFILFFEAWINFKWFGIIGASVIMLGIAYLVNRAQLMFMGANAKFNTGDKKSAFEKYEKAYKTGKLKPTHSLYFAYLLLRDGQIEKSEKLIDEIYAKYNKVQLRTPIFTGVLFNFSWSLYQEALVNQKSSFFEGRKLILNGINSFYNSIRSIKTFWSSN